jgi:hypothetical protein
LSKLDRSDIPSIVREVSSALRFNPRASLFSNLVQSRSPATNDKTKASDAKPVADGFTMFDAMERDACRSRRPPQRNGDRNGHRYRTEASETASAAECRLFSIR